MSISKFELYQELKADVILVAKLACEVAEILNETAGGAGGLTRKESFEIAMSLSRDGLYALQARNAYAQQLSAYDQAPQVAVPVPTPPIEQPAAPEQTFVTRGEVESALVIPPVDAPVEKAKK